MDTTTLNYIDALTAQQIKDQVDLTWNEVINGYFLSDIENLELLKLQPNKNVGLAAVGQFLTVASMLELLGKTMHDGPELLYYGSKRQARAWKYYFDNYLPLDINKLCEPIHNLIRHGSAHLFLPREVGLSKRTNEPLFFYEGTLQVFNVTTFTNYFKDSLINVKKDLDEKPDVAKRFLKKYEEVRQRNLDVYNDGNFSDVIKEYIDNLPPKSVTNQIPIFGITIEPQTTQRQSDLYPVSTPPAHLIPGSTPPTSSL